LKKRVVITGIGLVTPLGIGTEENWSKLVEGKSGVDFITSFDTTDFPIKIAGEAKGFVPENFINKKDARRYGRFMLLAVASSKIAISEAALDLETIDKERVGVSIGSGIGGLDVWESNHTLFMEHGIRKLSPLFIPSSIVNNATGAVTIEFGFKGPNLGIVTACASGLHAIGEAYRILQYGDADIMFAGGTEASITPFGVAGFAKLKALSKRNHEPKKASRPFDKDRDGFVMGEGCGLLILEELEHALSRKANIYAELVGYGMSGDAYHLTSPDETGDGAMRCMKAAINDAGIMPSGIDYINAHGTSTKYNDITEARSIKKLFGEHSHKLKISSTKSMTGHLMGATGSVEIGYTALSIKRGIIPPTINLDNPDDECDLDFVPNKAVVHKINYAMSNSFGFGGTNGSVVLKRYE